MQAILNLVKWKFISNYWYLKVNFLVPENLLWDTRILRWQELKCKDNKEMMSQNFFFGIWGYFEISVFEINRIYGGVEAETRKSQASFQII